jgi:hypothetical protein
MSKNISESLEIPFVRTHFEKLLKIFFSNTKIFFQI